MKSIGMIGIGAMGKGIAKNLINEGYPLTVFKRDTESGNKAASELEAAGASVTDKLSELYSSAEILILCVPNSKDVEGLLIEKEGLSESPGASVKTVLDFSTSHPESTKKIARILKDKGIDILDTPMTGTVGDAAEGNIKIIAGGEKSVFEQNKKLLNSVSQLVMYAGDHGCGNLVKLANNFLAILDQTAAAGISIILEKNNIPHETYNQFLGSSSANSGGFRLMMHRIMSGDFGLRFEMGLAMKDIGYSKDVFNIPIADTLYDMLKEAGDAGFLKKDIGTIYTYLKNK